MGRQSFLYFTIQGDDLDIIVAKEMIGLPCSIYAKGEKIFTKVLKNQIISRSTRWVYHAEDSTKKTDAFLAKHLEIILKKMPVLENYLKNYKALIDLVVYEDSSGKDTIILSKKTIKLLNKINVEFSISFK